MTGQDVKDLFDVFGGFLGSAIAIIFTAGFFWRGLMSRFDAQDLLFKKAMEQNEREHQEFKGDIHDHELRMRRYEWNRPIREGD